MPALSMRQPANVATPLVAASGLAVQASVAPAGVVIARATGAVEPVTVFPPASRTVTSGLSRPRRAARAAARLGAEAELGWPGLRPR